MAQQNLAEQNLAEQSLGEKNFAGLTIQTDNDLLVVALSSASLASPSLRIGELRDPDMLWRKLQKQEEPIAAYLYSRLDDNTRTQLESYQAGPPLPEPLHRILAAELSALIDQEEALYNPERFRHVYLPTDLRRLVEAAMPRSARSYVNRRLLEAAYPAEIARRVGAGLTLEAPPPPFHQVVPPPCFTIVLIPTDDRQHLVHFAIESEHPEVKRWARWNHLQRADTTLRQNRLNSDETEMTMEIQPTDAQGRTAMLSFPCMLDRQTQPGDYPFRMVFREIKEETRGDTVGEAVVREATLCLRHPESQYMTHLPNLYREALAPARFPNDSYQETALFTRFVLGTEESATPLWRLMGRLNEYFSPFATPPDFLPWLATWIGLALNENWPEMKRRLLLRNAVKLYTRRGTPEGLADYIEIYTGVRPIIQDQSFSGSFYLNSETRLGLGTHLGECVPHTFTITLPLPGRDMGELKDSIVREIVNAEKPAHTDAQIQYLFSNV